MQKRWVVKEVPQQEVIEELVEAVGVHPVLASLLAQRGVTDFEEARAYFRPSLKNLHDPFLLKDMDHAVHRLALAIRREEKILIYGDYDVDGTTSVALLYCFLTSFYEHVEFYIPDRYQEGYGVSEKGIDYAAENNFSLIISIDCGIRAVELINQARKKGIDFIVCDHHRPGETLPPAHAILNAKQEGCQYPYKELCGCGVGFKLLQAFCIHTKRPMGVLYNLLDFVAVAIAADIVPMTGENRLLAYYGLRVLNESPRPGFKALIEVAGLKTPLTIERVVFGIAPRINAAGRIKHAHTAVHLMLSEDEQQAQEYASALNQRNSQRRGLDTDVTLQALRIIEQDEQLVQAKSTVLFQKDWHKGVVGIVASRCIERYYRPTIILTESNGKATGSARSVHGFDVYEAITSCADLLEQFGGHTYAAGLTLATEKVTSFQQRFEEVVAQTIREEQLIPRIDVDQVISLSDVTRKFYSIIKQMAPFGPVNMQPVFVSEDLSVVGEPHILKEKHLKFNVQQSGTGKELCAIGFGMAHFHELVLQQPFRMAYSIEENHFNGHTSLQLMVRDIQAD